MRTETRSTIKLNILTAVLILCVALMFTSCGGGGGGSKDIPGKDRGKISIVTTIFPEYDWARAVTAGVSGSRVDLELLVDNGSDLHSYQPSAKDIMTISTCDVFVYVGGESDKWVRDVLDRSANKDMKVVCLMDVLGDRAKEEETVEGMEGHDGHEEGEDDGHSESHHAGHEETEYDEHVWLSLRNAEVFCKAIEKALSEADPPNAETYSKNAEEYIGKLDDLDERYSKAAESGKTDVLIFADRFPFRYLTEDYSLRYYAAFTGCSAETEASFETVRFLAEKLDEYGLGCILTIDGSDRKIAETIAANTKNKRRDILTLDSMQSVTRKDIDGGKTYLGTMEGNLGVLEKELNNVITES